MHRPHVNAPSLNFASDNTVGASRKVLDAILAANDGPDAAYGADRWTREAEERLNALFEREVASFLVPTGTAANALALASVVDPWGAVLTHHESHIAADECGAPEFYSAGAKLVGIEGTGGKLTPEALSARLQRMTPGMVHQVQAQALSITQSTECGLVYAADEVAALSATAHGRGLTVHMDGARFANAVAASNASPADITWRAGVDILSFGASKNGALAAEAVVFFDPARADELRWRRKRAGHTLSKGRLLGAQIAALLTDGHWLELARHANARAREIAEAVTAAPDLRLAWPVEANAAFIVMSEARAASLRAAGVVFHPWTAESLPPGDALKPGQLIGRFVCSFATTPEMTQALARLFMKAA
jgi:threonine aldolase